jgi:hypothetical protein
MIIWGQFSKGVSSLREKILPNHQGDQIRRIFAQWVNVYSGQLLQLQMHPTYLGYFIRWINLGKNFDKKWVGSHFGWFFQKLIWSPCQPHVCIAPHCVSRSTYIGTWFVHGHRPHAILSNTTYICMFNSHDPVYSDFRLATQQNNVDPALPSLAGKAVDK